MKKTDLLCALALLCSAAVSGAEILCTTPTVAAFTKAVTGKVPGMTVTVLLPEIAGCPHDYSLTPNDMKRLSKADSVVKNGLGFEPFLEGVVQRVNPKAKTVDASAGIPGVIHEKHGTCPCGHEHEHGHAHDVNSHAFAAPSTAAAMVRSIAGQLAKIYPAHAKEFSANAAAYSAKLESLAKEFAALKTKIPAAKRNIAVQHGIFDYLSRDSGLDVRVHIQHDDAEEPSAAEIVSLVREMRRESLSVILAEAGKPDATVKTVSRETGIPVIYLKANGASSDPEAALAAFRSNLEILTRFFLKK